MNKENAILSYWEDTQINRTELNPQHTAETSSQAYGMPMYQTMFKFSLFFFLISIERCLYLKT